MKQKIYRIKVKRVSAAEGLVIGRDKDEATCSFFRAINGGLVDYYHEKKPVIECHTVILNDYIKKEIEDGIIDQEGNLVWGDKTKALIEEFSTQSAAQAKEEWLKNNHLEFNFDK